MTQKILNPTEEDRAKGMLNSLVYVNGLTADGKPAANVFFAHNGTCFHSFRTKSNASRVLSVPKTAAGHPVVFCAQKTIIWHQRIEDIELDGKLCCIRKESSLDLMENSGV